MDRQGQITQALKTLMFIDAVKSDDEITVGTIGTKGCKPSRS